MVFVEILPLEFSTMEQLFATLAGRLLHQGFEDFFSGPFSEGLLSIEKYTSLAMIMVSVGQAVRNADMKNVYR